jgi:putative radical SAM enzyme (TIGR03279 family)
MMGELARRRGAAGPAMETSRGSGLPGGVVARVRPGTIAAELGLGPGDRLYFIDGVVPADYIDYRYLAAEATLQLMFIRPDGREVIFDVEKDPDEDLGVEFTEDVFGGPGAVKTCHNRCLFCFVDRLPVGLRPALYVKDDDYRLSFLHGNFVSLTNFSREDLERVIRMRLSPLYVSVHATEPNLRVSLMGNPRAAAIMDQLRELVTGGITVHAQLVVCPGINDGEHLDHTLGDLASLRPGVASVGIVPVGLTRYGPSESPVRLASVDEARALLEDVLKWHKRLGGFAYPADELFLVTGRKVPGRRFYDDFPQLQNGIGLARLFLDDLARLRRTLGGPREASPHGGRGFLAVSGSLAGSLVAQAVELISSRTTFAGEVLEVENEFLGPAVTVSGLLSGRDVLRTVLGYETSSEGPVLVPGAALRAGSTEFLDGSTLEDLGREAGRDFLDAGWLPSHMLAALRERERGR